ncbi:MAG TPA: alpha/beta hydrolase [Myxococcales bacterium]|nr:alpha/beta hydrolase [Myxococcales bacterium]
MNMIHDSTSADISQPRPGTRALIQNLWSLVSPDGFESPRPTHSAMPYRSAHKRGIKPLADVYLPTADQAHSASVVLVHGGGFFLGSRTMKPMRFLAGRLLDAGFSVCSIDYRLILRGGRLGECCEDVADAVLWWHQQCEDWALDPAEISLVGLSAGATLSLMTAADKQLPTPKRLVSVFGVYDYEYMRGIGQWLPKLLLQDNEHSHWREHSVINGPQPTCPTLLLHGDADALVPVAQAHNLATTRKQLGLPTAMRIYPNAPHGFFNYRTDTADTAARDIVSFLTGELT